MPTDNNDDFRGYKLGDMVKYRIGRKIVICVITGMYHGYALNYDSTGIRENSCLPCVEITMIGKIINDENLGYSTSIISAYPANLLPLNYRNENETDEEEEDIIQF